jgi:DNA mismatch endonuclease, patch repair protein
LWKGQGRPAAPLPDIVDQETRSRMMSGIRGRNTKPELLIRRALHARGYRYRLHSAQIPGRPDLVLRKFRAAIFVHGCFWHGHDCPLFRLPGTRAEFWEAKIARNRARDAAVAAALLDSGWRQLTIWECAMRGPGRLASEALIDRVAAWLSGQGQTLEIRGAA